ncbi:MAG: DUF1648 domain-containing protein [Sumerlaeia bacterium]
MAPTIARPAFWIAVMLSLVLVGGMVAVSAIAWNHVPATVPTHWNAQGQPDGFGSRAMGLLMTPVLGAFFALLMGVIALFEPKKEYFRPNLRGYAMLWISMVAFCAALHGFLVATYLGFFLPFNAVLLTLIGGLYTAIGLSAWHMHSDPRSRKVQRLVSICFACFGPVLMALAWVLPPTAGIVVMIVGTILISLGLVIFVAINESIAT